MEKIYLVCRVFNDHCTCKVAFPNEKLANNYKKYMEKKGDPVLASWVEEIDFDFINYEIKQD